MPQTYTLEVTLDQAKLINDAVRSFKVEVPLAQLDATQTSASYRDLIGKLITIMEQDTTPEVTPDVTPAPEEPVPPATEPEVIPAESPVTE